MAAKHRIKWPFQNSGAKCVDNKSVFPGGCELPDTVRQLRAARAAVSRDDQDTAAAPIGAQRGKQIAVVLRDAALAAKRIADQSQQVHVMPSPIGKPSDGPMGIW